MVDLKTCPWCNTNEHLSIQSVGSMTADMPARPRRVICTHIDHDTVTGPVAYGDQQAVAAWNTRTPITDEAIERVAAVMETVEFNWQFDFKELAQQAITAFIGGDDA